VPYQKELDEHGYYEDDLHLIVVINWRDNPWWNDEQERLRAWDYENRPRAEYDWIWEGKFNDSVEGSIIKPEWFDAAVDAHKIDKLKEAFKPHGAKVAAHDPFDDGGDAGGFAVRHGSIIQEVRQKDTGEIDVVCDWAVKLAKECGADWFVWDGDGMGTGLKRQISLAFDGTKADYYMFKGSLSGKGQDNAEKIYQAEFGTRRNNPKTYADTFKNNRSQYYIRLADRLYNTYKCVVKGEYINPDDMISFDSEGIDDLRGLRAELCRLPRKLDNDNGLEQLISKKEMKSTGIDSPNMADSVMMTLFVPSSKKKRKALNYQKMSIA
jgi:phage terminase large subunit